MFACDNNCGLRIEILLNEEIKTTGLLEPERLVGRPRWVSSIAEGQDYRDDDHVVEDQAHSAPGKMEGAEACVIRAQR